MPDNQWPKIKELLNDALELPSAERTAFLASITDGGLRKEVATLLSFEENANEMLVLSAVEFSKDFVDVDEAPMAGKQIGIYRIIRELGRGGMGTVYLAERNDKKFTQRVALKLLKSEMNSADIRRHFEQEREILAQLNHPNIALLLDAGTTDDNTPFIAMEYIDGLPIDKYCDERGYGVRERAELFRTVCAAVDHAHRNLVVHRDLKPSNVIVNNDGIPKLLDFGIAKIISAGMGGGDLATITKLGAMTPSYASPEQLSKKSVSTATDVYSLGIMLYELLSGHRPFEDDEHDVRKIYEAVLNSEPAPPSRLAADASHDIEYSKPPHLIIDDERSPAPNITVGRSRSDTRPHTLGVSANDIRGDLDNIVLKAIRKEPERRYLSAQSLSEDLGRFLNGLPVEARPNTFAYRAEKFITRNRLTVISVVVVAIAIIAGLAATLWQAQAARRERIRAEKRFSDVRKLANTYLFDVYPEVENLEGSLKAREKIVSTALEYLDSLAGESGDDPELQAELARAYEKIGDVQGATNTPTNADMQAGLESYRKARELREQVLLQKPGDPDAMNDLAQNYYVTARTLWWANDPAGAEEFFEKALKLRRELYAAHSDEAKFQDRLAVTLMDYGAIPAFNAQVDKAKPLFEEAKTLIVDLMNKQPDNSQFKKTYARFLRSYSEVKKAAGEYDSAISDLAEATRITEELIAETPDNYILNRSNWINQLRTCEVYIKKGDGENAVPVCVKAIDFNRESLKNEPDDAAAATDLAISYFNAARAYRLDRKHEKSIDNAKLALGVIADLLNRSPETNDYIRSAAIYRNEIAENEIALKRNDAALAELAAARGPLERVVESDAETTTFRYDLGNTYRLMAKAYFAKSDKERASELIGKAIECIQYLKEKNALSKADEDLLQELLDEKARYET